MAFNFQILGFIISWLIIMIYYYKEGALNKGTRVFRGILIVNYLIQLLFLVTSIAYNNDFLEEFYGSLYWLSMILLFGLYSIYTLFSIYHDKYKNSETILENKLKMGRNIFIVIIGLMMVISLIFMNPIFENGMIRYKGSINVTILFIFTIINFVLLNFNKKYIDEKKFGILAVVSIIMFASVWIQYYFEGASVLNSGMLFALLYLYINLENSFVKELERVKLERDNAIHQCSDKSSFLRSLSHEIRTPINTIDGFSQIIIDTDNTKEIKDDVKDIRVASKELINTINGMIDLAIIESGKLEIINEDYNVYDLIDNIVTLANSKMKDDKVSFEVDVEKDIPDVLFGDSERITQVIIGLLKNAIKYTTEGTISLNVSSVKSNSLCRLKFEVCDTSSGMDKEKLKSLYDYSDDKKSYNLDLRVSKYLVELMKGKIDVTSLEGKGTKFVVTLDQKIIKESSNQKKVTKKIIKPFDGTGKRILIVDDNKLNLKVATKMLIPYRVEVVEANSGQECLDILDNDTEFDLILMDDLMPELSGTQTLDIIKKIQRVDGYYIPVVVLTANAVAGMKEQYLKVGFEDYLPKPIEKEELDKILKKYVKKSDKRE